MRQGDISFAMQSLIIELPRRQITILQHGVASPAAILVKATDSVEPRMRTVREHVICMTSCYVMTGLRRAYVIVELIELIVDFVAGAQLFRVT